VLQLKERSAPAPTRSVGVLARAVQIAGELLITAGVILLLFVAWQLWWTNVESDAKQRDVIKDFAQDLKTGPAAPTAAGP
jgi:sortase A